MESLHRLAKQSQEFLVTISKLLVSVAINNAIQGAVPVSQLNNNNVSHHRQLVFGVREHDACVRRPTKEVNEEHQEEGPGKLDFLFLPAEDEFFHVRHAVRTLPFSRCLQGELLQTSLGGTDVQVNPQITQEHENHGGADGEEAEKHGEGVTREARVAAHHGLHVEVVGAPAQQYRHLHDDKTTNPQPKTHGQGAVASVDTRVELVAAQKNVSTRGKNGRENQLDI